MSTRSFPFHEASSALVSARADRVFAYLDDPKALAAHMGESSLMMMGSRLSINVDADGGRVVGSQVRMQGRMMGIPLSLEEVITERQVPNRKVWETIGTPKLLIMAHYRMGFDLTPTGDASMVRVFIDYRLPTTAPGSWLGYLLGGVYARWCTKQMVNDVATHFNNESKVVNPETTRLRWSGRIFALCGIWLVALGAYFLFLRPALLPEDPRYIGSSLEAIRLAVPGLERWLAHVFNVMGGFMVATGVMTTLASYRLPATRELTTFTALIVAGAVSVGLMSATNFFLNSNFRWLLVLPALLWLAGLFFYLRERVISAREIGRVE